MPTTELPTTELPTAMPERSATGARAPRGIRPLIMRLHFYAGILVAPFILIAAISGGLYALAPSAEKVVYRDYLHVDSVGPAVPVADQITAAQRERPDLRVAAVRPAARPGDTTRVLFTDPGLGESERLAVFVDPATAHPVGELPVYGSGGALPMRAWIDQLHRELHLGEPGRLYSELAASWLWVVALGGVSLWIDRYRKAKRRNRAAARLLTVSRLGSRRNRTLNWHGVVGLWLAAGLVFLSATGLTWSKYTGQNVTELRSALNWKTPTVSSGLAPDHEHGSEREPQSNQPARHIAQIDSVLRIAAANGVDGKVEATVPADAHTATTVVQTRQPWVLANNAIAIDAATGQVVDRLPYSDWPLMAKLSNWGIALHMGILFGLVSQLALVALSVALVSVIVRGYLMWWRRRPGRPPARGALRGVPPAVAIAVFVGAVGVGYFVPLLGVSLLGFVIVDFIVGRLSPGKIG